MWCDSTYQKVLVLVGLKFDFMGLPGSKSKYLKIWSTGWFEISHILKTSPFNAYSPSHLKDLMLKWCFHVKMDFLMDTIYQHFAKIPKL